MRRVASILMVTGLLLGLAAPAAVAEPDANSCWGQASQVFAQEGAMGEHASSFAHPRLGLRNLARALADAGVIPDDSMQALGAFVAGELGLSIDACE
jgi:hypothetical protein